MKELEEQVINIIDKYKEHLLEYQIDIELKWNYNQLPNGKLEVKDRFTISIKDKIPAKFTSNGSEVYAGIDTMGSLTNVKSTILSPIEYLTTIIKRGVWLIIETRIWGKSGNIVSN